MGGFTVSGCRSPRVVLCTVVVVALGLGVSPVGAEVGAQTDLVSVSSAGAQANDNSGRPSISADGRFVAFYSVASNLVEADTNSALDVFVYDRSTREIQRVSVSSTGTQANDHSASASVSADGRFVALDSSASNLVDADTNGSTDAFVYDRTTEQTQRVSVSAAGRQANGNSGRPSISADGRFVAFESNATNLVRNDTNGRRDVFVFDRSTQETRRVSVSSTGTQANRDSGFPAISADGRLVAFNSAASNLVPADTNDGLDVFLYDRPTGKTQRVSVSSTGTQANGRSLHPSISADGRFVAFTSAASNLVRVDTSTFIDVFVHDLSTGQNRQVSVTATGTPLELGGDSPSISADGRFTAFSSGTGQVRMYDLLARQTEPVSVSSTGVLGNDLSWKPSISADGRFVAFESAAWNLGPDDNDDFYDVFVRGPLR